MSDLKGFAEKSWTRRALEAAVLSAAVAAVFIVLWYGAQVLLLVFAGVLLGLLLSGLACLIARRTGLPYRPAFVIVLVSVLGLIGLLLWLFASRIAGETEALSRDLPRAVRELIQPLQQYQWVRDIIDEAPRPDELIADRPEILSKATGVASSVMSAVTSCFVVAFLGIFIGFDTRLYRNGIVRLVPPLRRDRAAEVMDRLGHTLRWWLAAHFSSMAVVGILTGAGLWFLDIPLAFLLAVIAALLAFIPNVGPVLSAAPALILALSQSPSQALYVGLLYISVQAVESNVITPVIELKAISLPPALTISVQVLLGTLVGVIGLLVAAPLCAAAMVLVQMLYIEDRLGESSATGGD